MASPGNDELFNVIQRWVAANYPRRLPRRLSVELDDGEKVRLPVPGEASNTSATAVKPVDLTLTTSRRVHHSPDFASVEWFGRKYTFTPLQAACVRVMWEAWEDGAPAMTQTAILEEAGSRNDSGRLRYVFRGVEGASHPAWGTMIVRVGKGSYQLNEPANAP